jgi:3-oxoacyl-[acyl-carrier-protein] synthase II
MNLACQRAGISPEDVDYVNAHGTGTPLNDSAEAHAIQRWAGSRTKTLPVSSTKAGIGHLLGAAGAVEALVCLMALQEQFLPPEPAFETPDPACTFPVVREPRDASLRVALSNSFGFGGVNATLLFRRWE